MGARRQDFASAAKQLDELRQKAAPAQRMTSALASKAVKLNIFEKGEIIDYRDVYFCGAPNAKKHVGELRSQSTNFGYDDERGDYKIIAGDHLAYRYEIVDVLGKGSFGQVVRCIDHKTGGLVAVKIIRNKKRFHQQALIEVDLLKKLKEWVCNVVTIELVDGEDILVRRLLTRHRILLDVTALSILLRISTSGVTSVYRLSS